MNCFFFMVVDCIVEEVVDSVQEIVDEQEMDSFVGDDVDFI